MIPSPWVSVNPCIDFVKLTTKGTPKKAPVARVSIAVRTRMLQRLKYVKVSLPELNEARGEGGVFQVPCSLKLGGLAATGGVSV